MGMIANQGLLELILRLKERAKVRKEQKKKSFAGSRKKKKRNSILRKKGAQGKISFRLFFSVK